MVLSYIGVQQRMRQFVVLSKYGYYTLNKEGGASALRTPTESAIELPNNCEHVGIVQLLYN